MGNLSVFLKQNKTKKENYKYAASKAFKDEDGNTVEWEIKPISTRQYKAILADCTHEVPIKGKVNTLMPKVDNDKLMNRVIAASVVYPNLNDISLQSSYDVMGAEDLLMEMIDEPGEYVALYKFISDISGFSEDINQKVETVKN